MNSSEIVKIIGRNIKELRNERKISQQDLAEECNFEKSNLARIESGRTNPTVKTLFKISEALKIPLATLFDIHHTDAGK